MPTARVLWHSPPVLALASLPGTAIARLGEPSTASPTAWRAAGEAVRALHDAPLPPWPSRRGSTRGEVLAGECDWLVTNGVLDWSEAGRGDPAYDLAVLTMGHREHLDDVLDGYGGDVDLDVVRGWWSLRSLTAIRWLGDHGFDPFAPGCEVDVLRAQRASVDP